MAENFNIDNLIIDIQSSSAKAETALNNVANGLATMQTALAGMNTTALTQVASGIREVANSMQAVKGIDSRSINALVKKFNALGNIDSAKLVTTATALGEVSNSFNSLGTVATGSTENIAKLVTAISGLGNGRVTQATANIPALGTALKNLFTTLSTAPTVNQNIINMTNALANLARNGSKVSSASNSISKGLNKTTVSARNAGATFKGLASTIGMFYAKWFLIVRGIKEMWQAVDSSMDYVETYNYWSVALGKVQNEYGGDWERWSERLGVQSAEAYADSFGDRLKQLTKKMTGYNVGDYGELIETGTIGLGMDAEQLMNYEARILGVTNSVGVLGETSINTAKGLSMLAGDLSSLTNTDLGSVMDNLQSGLIGQARALYKYGIDITSATLETYALANGVTKSVTEMSQAEKMQVRLLAILEQSKVAWGDQANTINSVANQFRIFQQQTSNLGRVLGNLFLPIVKMVLPYINALIITLKQLFTTLGFKIWGDNWLKDLQDGISGGALTEDTEELVDDLDDATGSAKKLKHQLQGFDELNVINSQSSGGSGVGGLDFDLADEIANALDDYESVWNKALENASNKAEEIAKTITKAFDKVKGSQFVKSMKDLYDTLKKIAGIAFGYAIDFYNEFLKPVASWVGNTVVKRLVDSFVDFSKKVDWDRIKSALSKIWETLKNFTLGIGQGLLDFFGVLLDLGLDILAGAINVVATALDGIFGVLSKIPPEVLTAIGGAIAGILTLFGTIKVAGIIADLGTKLGTFATNLVKTISAWLTLNPQIVAISAVAGILGAIAIAVQELNKAIGEAVWDSVIGGMSSATGKSLEDLGSHFTDVSNKIKEPFDALEESMQGLPEARGNIDLTVESIGKIKESIEIGAYSVVEKVPEIRDAFQTLYDETKTIFDQEYDVIVMGVAGALSNTLESMGVDIPQIIDQLHLLKNGGDEQLTSLQEKMDEINTKFDEGGLSAQEYYDAMMPLYQQMADFTSSGTLDTLTQKLEETAGALDLTKYIDENGNVDIEAINAYMDSISQIFADGVDSIEQDGEDFSDTITDFKTRLDQLGVDTSGFDWSALYSANTQSVESAKQDFLTAFNDYTDQIQLGLLEQVPQIMQNASDKYKDLKWYEKLFKTEGNFVSDAVQQWEKEVMTPFESNLQTQFENLGLTGQTYVGDIYDQMFDKSFWALHSKFGDVDFLRNDWENTLNGLLTDVSDALETDEFAQDTIDGYNNGIKDHMDESEKPMNDWANTIYNAFHNSRLDFGSPSKAMFEFGEDTIQGFVNGINRNQNDAGTAMQELAQSAYDAFESRTSGYDSLGVNIIQGIINGLNSKVGELKTLAGEIADGIKSTISDALDIHSPSRVMFELGEYTVEGFKNGMENLYGSTIKSLKNFGTQLAQPQSIGITNTMATQTVGANNGGMSSDIAGAVYNAISSAMPRQNGTNVSISLEGDASGLFKVVQKGATDYTNRTGRPAF